MSHDITHGVAHHWDVNAVSSTESSDYPGAGDKMPWLVRRIEFLLYSRIFLLRTFMNCLIFSRRHVDPLSTAPLAPLKEWLFVLPSSAFASL